MNTPENVTLPNLIARWRCTLADEQRAHEQKLQADAAYHAAGCRRQNAERTVVETIQALDLDGPRAHRHLGLILGVESGRLRTLELARETE
jgi:hypothetical protein